MATIVRCNNCGAEYHRTAEKFLVPHTSHASCTICGDTLEYWVDDTHLAIFELVRLPKETPKDAFQTKHTSRRPRRPSAGDAVGSSPTILVPGCTIASPSRAPKRDDMLRACFRRRAGMRGRDQSAVQDCKR